MRRAVIDHKVPLIDLSSAPHGLSRQVTHALAPLGGEAGLRAEQLVAALNGNAVDDAVRAAAAAIAARPGNIVVIVGRANLGESAALTMRAAAALTTLANVRFLSALRRSNVHGALEAGLAPGILPGRVTLEHRDGVEQKWSIVPEASGLDALGILRAAADGKIRVLVLVGADPIADFPDRDLATKALASVDTIITIDAFRNESTKNAKVFLASTLFGEKSGTITNLEGRVQRVNQKVSPEGTAMDDWRIVSELAFRLADDWDLESVDEITGEFISVSPALAGATTAVLREARDGVRIPVAEHANEIVLRKGSLSILSPDSMSWEPIKVDDSTQGESVETVITSSIDGDLETSDGPVESESLIAVAQSSLLEWSGQVANVELPARDAYALRLIAAHKLYDHGLAVGESPSLTGLRALPELAVAAADLQRLGVPNGTEVRVASTHGAFNVAVRAVRGIAQGTAVLPLGGERGANVLIDAASVVTDVRVETIQ